MSTGPRTISLALPSGDVPGLSLSVTVPSLTSAVVISSDGGVQVNSGANGVGVVLDILLFVDASPNETMKRRIIVVNNNSLVVGVTNWAFSYSVTGLTPGTHTFRVAAQYIAASAGVSALVGGSSMSVLRGSLTGVIINP